jgi:hypothetical protein
MCKKFTCGYELIYVRIYMRLLYSVFYIDSDVQTMWFDVIAWLSTAVSRCAYVKCLLPSAQIV